MKKTLSFILSIILILAFATTSLGFVSITVKSIKLNTGNIIIQAGKTYTIKVTITPVNATNKKMTFSSANKSIATVDANGKIKGIKEGKTVITVTSLSNKKAVAKCNVTVSQAKPATIRFMHYIVTNEAADKFKEMVASYNLSHPQIKINLEMVPWSNYLDKLVTMTAAGMAPHSSAFKSMWLPTFQGMQALAPLEEYLEAWEYKNDIFDKLIPLYKQLSEDKKLYLIPFSMVTSYITYRKDMFKEAGIEPPKTMDEFLVAAKKLTKDKDGDGKIDQYGYTMRANANGQGGWFCFAFANMKNPSFYVNGKLSFSTPEVIEANQFWVDLFKVNKVCPPTAPMDGTNENIANLVSGRAAMMIHHVQTSKKLQSQLGENFGVIQIPTGKNGQRFSTIEETGMAIYNSCKNKEAAFDFISWLIEPEQHKKLIETGDTVVFMKSLMDSYKNDPVQKVSMDSLKDGEFTPATPYMGEWTTKTWPATTAKALEGQINSKEMLRQLEDAMYGKK